MKVTCKTGRSLRSVLTKVKDPLPMQKIGFTVRRPLSITCIVLLDLSCPLASGQFVAVLWATYITPLFSSILFLNMGLDFHHDQLSASFFSYIPDQHMT